MILIRSGGEPWRKPETSAFTDEAALQALLAESPDLLPGVDPGAVVATELSVPGTGRADIVVVEPNGDITVVECKLASNSESRRAVVGQILAYAAGLTGMSHIEFADTFGRASPASLADLETDDYEGFQRAVEGNLREGRFRLIVAVDTITQELKQIITYLNQKTSSAMEIVALELEYVRDGSVETLIPRVYGVESAESKPNRERRKWDRASLEDLVAKNCSPAVQRALQALFAHHQAHGLDIYWGDGRWPSATFWYPFGDDAIQPFSVYGDPESATLAINFEWIANKDPDRRAVSAFAAALAADPALATRVEEAIANDYRKRPSIPAEATLGQPGFVDRFLKAIDELLEAGRERS